MDEAVRDIAQRVSRELLEQGAKATVLTGSQARGTATEHSDVDIFAVGEGEPRFEFVDGRLVIVYWWTAEEARLRMYRPQSALVSVRGWADAEILDDPDGVAAELQREAREWSWDKIGAQADAWVCDQLVIWSEYVSKLVSALDDGRELDAAAFRAELTVRLAELLAVRRRVMSESENGLWDTIADAGGAPWRRALEAAFSLHGEDLEAACGGALTLFALLVADADELFDERQQSVVGRALELAAPRLSGAARRATGQG